MFYTSSLLVAIGAVIIVQRGLMFENFYEDLPPPPIPTEIMLYMITLYFVSTALMAWKKAAIDRSFNSHQDWMIRQVPSGLWVAIQRVLLLAVFGQIHRPPVPREAQRQTFAQAAQAGLFISVAAGEYAIFLLHQTSISNVGLHAKSF
jgi:hypothetical protein